MGNIGNQLENIQIYFNEWSGTIPTSLGKLRGLTNLALWNSPAIFGTIPTEIGMMKSLRQLVLQGTSMSGRIHLLLFFFFSRAHFLGTIPREFVNLSHLEYLFLNGDFEGTIPDYLGDIPKLNSLALVGKWSGTIPDSLERAPLSLLILPVCSVFLNIQIALGKLFDWYNPVQVVVHTYSYVDSNERY